jgi:hypothetical protein
MLSEGWRALAREYIAYDFFDEMAACFHCDRVRCPANKYEICPDRLAQTAASKAESRSVRPLARRVMQSSLPRPPLRKSEGK